MVKGEWVSPYQPGSDETGEEGSVPTHTIARGASIKVQTSRGWAWAVVTSDLARIHSFSKDQVSKDEQSQHRGLHKFIAIDDFSAILSHARIPWNIYGGHLFWGFSRPQDGTVQKIPKTK